MAGKNRGGLQRLVRAEIRKAIYENRGGAVDPTLRMYLGEDIAETDQKLMGVLGSFYNHVRKKHKDWSREKVVNYLCQSVARSMSEEDESGGLERKTRTGFFGRLLKTKRFMGGAGTALDEIAKKHFREGDYDPIGIRKSAETVRYLEKLDDALGIFRRYGVTGPIDKYLSSRNVHVAAKREVEKVKEGMRSYIEGSYSKVAASILGIFGTGLIAVSGTGITGNVIGNSTANISGIAAGMILLVLAFALWISVKKS